MTPCASCSPTLMRWSGMSALLRELHRVEVAAETGDSREPLWLIAEKGRTTGFID